ncbi:MAG: hypothetical protein ACTHMM_05490 [Agriterribacter sp.]
MRINFLTLLLLLFIALKLTGDIDWPWAWVLIPLWAKIILLVASIIFTSVVKTIAKENPDGFWAKKLAEHKKSKEK